MKKIRVLVVDDSVVVRRLISDLLSSDSSLEVVGVAANGRIALEKIPQVNPDVITLDLDMPELDGLQTLAVVRKSYPHLPVIILSSLSERGTAQTLDALVLGASDYVTKPVNASNSSIGLAGIREELIAKIKTLYGRKEIRQSHRERTRESDLDRSPTQAPLLNTGKPPEIVAIGASTGGPNALTELISAFPADFSASILIAQHMPPLFTTILANRLASRALMDVQEGIDGTELMPGKVWIAPGDRHMAVVKDGLKYRLRLNQDPPENSCRPSVDVLFRSVAKVYGDRALGVILTGMGKDGLRGCKEMVGAGAQILVQDEVSSVVWGMPGFVARAGLAHRILPLKQLADEVLQRVQASKTKADSAAQERLQRACLGD